MLMLEPGDMFNEPLLHASHRGEDMLASLRLVLSTVSERFTPDIFLRFPLMSKTEEETRIMLDQPDAVIEMQKCLLDLARFIHATDC